MLDKLSKYLVGNRENAIGGITPWKDVGFLQKFGMGLGGADVVGGYQDAYRKALGDADAATKQSKLAQLAQLDSPEAMLQGAAKIDPAYLSKYAEMLNNQNKPKVPETSGLPEGYMWQNGQATPIAGITPKAPSPQSPEGKLEADFRAGLVSKEQRDAKSSPTKKQISVPGFDIIEGQQPTADDAKKLKAASQAKEVIKEQLKAYKDLVKEYGSETFGGSAANKMSQRLKMIQLNAKNLEELGALQAPDIEILSKMLPDATSFMGSFNPYRKDNVLEGIDIYDNYINQRLNQTALTRGYAPRNEVTPSDSSGFKIIGVK